QTWRNSYAAEQMTEIGGSPACVVTRTHCHDRCVLELDCMTDLIATEPIARWISSLNVGAALPMTFERVGAGTSNLTFLVTDAGGKQWILRRPSLAKLMSSAHDVARDSRILSGLQNTGVPVPGVHGLCNDPHVTDAPIVLMDFIDGRVVGSLESAAEISA